MKTSLRMRLAPVLVLVAVVTAACGGSDAEPSAAPTTIATAVAHQDAGHTRLDRLVGEWSVEKSTYVAGGTPDHPLVAHDTVSRWHWITKTGNNFLQEEVDGTLGDKPYYRQGALGYSPTDDRYEWSTVDSMTPMMMTYRGAKNSGSAADIVMTGDFTDPGILGPANAGKTTPMRTVIRFESPDRTVMEIYFTPAGGAEVLADRVVLTRRS
ncbi:DUF1579 family protein [Nocardia veterana]|uniref:DUF1579 domain-containing protein n=1 Tax=Nocardia veterana TaxID=132249 RepID=A0A7X6RIU7_9NOCA|nr:DUF1579 family protein [Nocardia veterana]NKY87500.1 DUF1579 domain-containing protein [Nocardia veterana]